MYKIILTKANEKTAPKGGLSYIREEEKSLLAEEQVLALIDYIFDLSNRQIKLLRKWLIADSVQ